VAGAAAVRMISVSLLTAAFACGVSQTPTTPRVDTSKIPMTTSSELARDAFLKGRWLFDNLRVTDAHEYFLKAVEADPQFALAHLRVANTAATNQEFFEALRRAIEHSGNASGGERLLIGAFEAAVAGDPETQQAKLEALVALFPNDERAHNAIGNFFFFNQQDYERAISAFKAAIEVNPEFAQPYNQLGYALRFIGDFEGAEKAFQRYAELIPDQPNPYDSYAELLMRMGRFEESIERYKKALAIEPTFIASYIGIGNDQIFMGLFEDARSTFTGIEDIARNDAERRQACTWRAASYLHEGDFENALIEIDRRYDIAAETDDRTAMSADLNTTANILLFSGRIDEAAETYDLQLEMMQSSDAIDEIKEGTVRNRKWDLARVALAEFDLATASELASEYRQQVAEHNIRFEVQRTHELEGMIALAEGNFAEALEQFEQANQQNPQVWLLKARAYAATGDSVNGRSACEHVVHFNQINFNLAYVRKTARGLLETF
jgi:tetratricopeptide (TPR) repeat protein